MNNPNLGVMLRYYRQAADLSVQQVVDKLQNDYNIKLSPKTVYGWETNQNQPSADTLLTLCKMYNVTNLLESLGYNGPEEQMPLILTKEERELVLNYRTHKQYHNSIRKLLDM